MEANKEKKKTKVEVAKEKKKIEAKTIAWKKIKDRVAKNVEISLQKNRLVYAKRHFLTTLLQKRSNKR